MNSCCAGRPNDTAGGACKAVRSQAEPGNEGVEVSFRLRRSNGVPSTQPLRYPASMPAANSVISERRFVIPLPRPLWIGVATVVLIAVAVAMKFGFSIYRRHLATEEIERLRGYVETRPRGPKWLRAWAGEERMKPFDDPILVQLGN